ncbi:PHD finger protein ING1 isoform X2 [Physcomitrium patens]|uniref:PHD finger protein ING n=1 Tax=Physcomitrium patens TaxID=3218 RepID=A0A7I4BFC7_PHYPA|nr:PHD finger protein ING1-like isoform X2 [Physcomitrium patens]|eukprot:XP_024399799.1 PHD finger protein ING1-like isoform X2 [Physcomitrella patens]
MTYLEDYISSVQTLPTELQKNYQLLRELDQKFQALQKHMQVQCAKGLEEVRKAKESGSASPDTVALQHSNEVLNVHKACLTVAEEKVFLAVQTYDLVDGHIQRLDKDLKKFEEELRRDREAAGGGLLSAEPRLDGVGGTLGRDGGDGTRFGRRKGAGGGGGGQTIPTNVNVELDLPVDPNEPTYCYCGQVSYGEMIACDNSECKIEWFHFDCVGIKERPKGKWYCSDCAVVMKRRRPKLSIGGKAGHPSTKKVHSDFQYS